MTAEKGDVIISVKDLKKYYNGESIKALDGVTTDIRKGEVVVIIGPSGSGKSTFLRSLNLLERPTSGTITFDGVDITSKATDINKLRQRMGMVFQHFNLFPHLTILKNMTLGPIKLRGMSKAEAERRSKVLLERVGLVDRADAYPSQLSGGQKQRIAIVRALAMKLKQQLSHKLSKKVKKKRKNSNFSTECKKIGVGKFFTTEFFLFIGLYTKNTK